MTTEALYDIYLKHPSVQTDTRLLKKGDIFFALKGPNFNGNLFAVKALDAGAAYCVIDESPDTPDERLILVQDVLDSLQQLAGYHRRQFRDVPFIAITGSNGKTTTKELVNAVLSSYYRVSTTKGNLNNHIGIPLTLLAVPRDAEMAVIEMGANHLREIEGYCRYTQPTHGIITNCGKAHLEGFGSEEGVRKGKGELFDFLRTVENGTAFIFSDYPYLADMSRGISRVIRYGTRAGEVTGTVSGNEPFLEISMHGGVPFSSLHTQLVGEYNLPNVLCAICIGMHFGVPAEKIREAIEGYRPSNSRSQLVNWGSNEVILDAYNANPSSMKAAIENFAGLREENKVLILGSMMELGPSSAAEHAELVHLISRYHWKQVVLVGEGFSAVAAPYLYFNTSAEAAEWFRQQHFDGAHILIKGSRSMKMEKLLPDLITNDVGQTE